ncbi:hypothetical protein PFISCL1PPCAC_27969 [Pristionchus fissidentatus]|uniref:RING-type domain-containing protein n=1 Tax=Pristionchus fissidentatus TaxID=1538716 RepID=A0AAV5X357_9BILA|nr:hypothetical protein PFISCL1PPCAC_27969 [Pristionchus fissidentatus]
MGNGDSRSLLPTPRLRRPPRNSPDSVKSIEDLSWDDFAACVRSVNAKCRGLVNEQGEYFAFGAKHGSSRDDGWKAHLQILCVAVHTQTGVYRSVRSYTLQRFLNIHHALSMIPETVSVPSSPSTLSDSIFVECSTEIPTTSNDVRSPDEKSCCICFDRDSDTILSCTHSFCSVCVVAWSEYRLQFQCPLCKAAIRSPITDSWELMSEQPTTAEMRDYFTSLSSERAGEGSRAT